MSALQFQDMEELERYVNREIVATLEAWQVRDAYGSERLGERVRAGISAALRGRGIGHWPEGFPDRQWELVRLYKIDSRAGRLLEAAVTPGDKQDQVIREAANEDAAQILDRLRELVCP